MTDIDYNFIRFGKMLGGFIMLWAMISMALVIAGITVDDLEIMVWGITGLIGTFGWFGVAYVIFKTYMNRRG